MISLEDCIGLCGLDGEQVEAISEHEHIPEIAAAALASYLLRQPMAGKPFVKASSGESVGVESSAVV